MNRDDTLFDLAERKHQLIVRSDVTRAGLTSDQWCRRLEHGVWMEAAPDVWRHSATPVTWQLRARAGLLWLGPQAALYGRTAAKWWGIDQRPIETVEFVVPRARRTVDGPFVVHTTTAWNTAELLRRDGVRLTNATRTIIDMASTEPSAHALEKVIDEAMRQRRVTLNRLTQRAVELCASGRRGTVLLRTLLLDSGGESYLERRFLALVRRERLPRPTCQVVHKSGNKTIARVDFLFPGTNVVVEVSGRLGHVSIANDRRTLGGETPCNGKVASCWSSRLPMSSTSAITWPRRFVRGWRTDVSV